MYKCQITQIIYELQTIQFWTKQTMDKTISSSSFDVIVIRQPNNTYKSTPFQVAFSSNLLKSLTKKNQVILYVNEEKIDLPLRFDPKNGRITFVKTYEKRNILSDSSDFQDDDKSQRSSNRGKIITTNIGQTQTDKKKEDFKNQKAPKPFWQFAWLFKTKIQPQNQSEKKLFPNLNQQQHQQVSTNQSASTLQKIQEELYQGQDSSKEPMFHISLCKSALKRKQKKEEILTEFYKRRIPYQQFIKDPPKYLSDSELIVKIDDSLYTWQLGIAILTCRLAYGKQLSQELIDDMIRNKFTKSKFITYFTGENLTKIDISTTTEKKEFTVNNSSTNNFPTKTVTRHGKTPDTEAILKMNLKQGLNKGKFILNTGTTKQEINMKIFLWDYREKLIVSDIDGTITKSDIAGQLLTNYIHLGVTKLFAQAYKRGYKIVYLTARAIGQYNQTTKFLQNAEEDGVKLPEGPLLMSPDGYFKSFTREVIDKTPDYLKTKILATLNEIFPHRRKPLYCGFGNRETDSVAYLRTNMDPDKIFFITPKSVISKQSKTDFTTTYSEMLQKIQEYFPIYTREQEELIEVIDDLRRSKLSVDLDEEQEDNINQVLRQVNQKQLQSLSQSSEKSSIKKQILGKQVDSVHLSQRIKRINPIQGEEISVPVKHLRSKSVEHVNQTEQQQEKSSLFNQIIRNIKPFMSSHKSPTKHTPPPLSEFNEPLPKQQEYKAPEQNKILEINQQACEKSDLLETKNETIEPQETIDQPKSTGKDKIE